MVLSAAVLLLWRWQLRAPADGSTGTGTLQFAGEAHGEETILKFVFPGKIKDSNCHGVHDERGGPDYLA
jgi:hypothetical protein